MTNQGLEDELENLLRERENHQEINEKIAQANIPVECNEPPMKTGTPADILRVQQNFIDFFKKSYEGVFTTENYMNDFYEGKLNGEKFSLADKLQGRHLSFLTDRYIRMGSYRKAEGTINQMLMNNLLNEASDQITKYNQFFQMENLRLNLMENPFPFFFESFSCNFLTNKPCWNKNITAQVQLTDLSLQMYTFTAGCDHHKVLGRFQRTELTDIYDLRINSIAIL